MIKGVTRIDDAKRAVDAGVTAISVSNHGGNELYGTPATTLALRAVAEADGDQIEVLLDGGIRRGGDVVKAVALGARDDRPRLPVGPGRTARRRWRTCPISCAAASTRPCSGRVTPASNELTPDDMLVPPRFTRRLGAADESARRILNHGSRPPEEADTR